LNTTTHLKSAYLNSTRENLEVLINYLKNIGGKTLTVICRRQNAFKIRWTKQEVNLRSRCHIQNAVEYLQSIEDKYSERQIKVVIADIAKYVNCLDANEDVSFLILSTNTLPSAIHFDAAKRLFYTHQIRDQNQNNYNTDLLAIYALRLALENRIKGLLGIDYATNKGKPVSLASLINICRDLKSVKYSNAVNWTEIEWVNDWVNHHMHRHIRPYPWIIHQAIELLKSFIHPKEPLVTESSTTYSFYSATYVKNEEELHEEIISALKQKNPEIEIAWLSKREIMKRQNGC
jgi:hypothetical protein